QSGALLRHKRRVGKAAASIKTGQLVSFRIADHLHESKHDGAARNDRRTCGCHIGSVRTDRNQRYRKHIGMMKDKQDPQWRQDFPIEIPRDEYVSRRDFTKFLMLVSLAFVVGQFWILLLNWKRRIYGEPELVPIAGAENLQPGQSLIFQYPQQHDPCVLV